MTAISTLWGPAAIGAANSASASLTNTDLNDSNNAAGWTFTIPKNGTITDVGMLLIAETGTSPAFNCGIVTLDSSGVPTTTAYGGSAITSAQWTSVGWKWVTLSTPATAVAGEFAAVHIYPGGTPPDASNYVSVYTGGVCAGGMGVRYLTSWAFNTELMGAPFAVKYNDGSIYGFALTSGVLYSTYNNTGDPDERGNKFTLPAAMTCTGTRLMLTFVNSPTVDVVLYDGSNNVLASTSIGDKDYVDGSPYVDVFWDTVNLSASTTYRLVVKPTSGVASNTVTIFRYYVESAAARSMWPAGADWQYTYRTDGGAWTDEPLAVMYGGLWVSDITFSAGATSYEYGFIG